MQNSMQTIQTTFPSRIQLCRILHPTPYLISPNPLLKDFFQDYTEQGFQRKALVIVDEGFEQTHPELSGPDPLLLLHIMRRTSSWRRKSSFSTGGRSL
jgi:hypothetical protein